MRRSAAHLVGPVTTAVRPLTSPTMVSASPRSRMDSFCACAGGVQSGMARRGEPVTCCARARAALVTALA